MKFKKLMFGLAVTPFLFASCSNALKFNDVKNWIGEHYKHSSDDTQPAIAFVSWDFRSTSGTTASDYIFKIFQEIEKASEIEGLSGIVPTHPDEKEGQKIIIADDKIQHIVPLNGGNFVTYSDVNPEKNDTYKINNGCFSVTYTKKIDCIPADIDPETKEETYTYSSCGRVYNTEGYCTDFGYKANKFIDKENSIKLKFLVHFIYQNDPID